MNKRAAILIFATLLLAIFYVYKFTDWFQEKKIHILSRTKKDGIFFGLEDKEYPLTQIKVVRVDEIATNKYAHAMWHLVAESNSAPVTDFVYGLPIPGMKPAVTQTVAEPLLPNVPYRILVEAGKLKGEKDFQVR